MRLLIIAILILVLNWIFYYTPASFPFDFAELELLVFALGGIIFIEGILSLRKNYKSDPNIEDIHLEYENLRLQILDLGDSLRSSNETINTLRDTLSRADNRISEEKSKSKDELTPPKDSKTQEEGNAQIISLLSVLQNKGRLIDFLMQDLSKQEDGKIVAVAKFIHAGCRQALKEHIQVEAVFSGTEGDHITLEKGFNPAEFKISGKISNNPPFVGKVVHKGWRTVSINLPQIVKPSEEDKLNLSDYLIITPAEVEVN
jgi:Domain of unknown function (DUF2760)